MKNVGLILALTIFILTCGCNGDRRNKVMQEVLYNKLAPSDANAIIEELRKANIKYELADNNTTIMVNKDEVSELRIHMAGQGLPIGGTMGYELFDVRLGASGLGQMDRVRRFQGELTRTIEGLDSVEDARIKISLPEETEHKKPFASVYVKQRKKETLNKEQIRGIMHLVAACFDGMKPSDVQLIDSEGNILSALEKQKTE